MFLICILYYNIVCLFHVFYYLVKIFYVFVNNLFPYCEIYNFYIKIIYIDFDTNCIIVSNLNTKINIHFSSAFIA